MLLEQTDINKHAIKLEEGKKPSYRPIYNLGPVELKIFKTYIKINLANGFIWPSKSLVYTLIFFVYKSNDNLHLYVNYQGLFNFIIKNWYLLPLNSESLNWLKWVKHFI